MFCEQEAVFKATAGNVADSSLSFLSSTGGPGAGGVWGQGGFGGGGVGGGGPEGRGQGTFPSTCHVLRYHMVLRPKGTSHNEWMRICPR